LNIAWQHIALGDREAYSQAYLLLYERFYNYGFFFTSDIALVEDAVQEVLLTLWSNREALNTITNPNGYYFSIFRTILFKKLKAAANLVAVEKGEWEPEFPADAIMIRKEASEELRKKMKAAIDTLTPRQQEAIYLRFYEGLSYEEVAATLEISVKATYKVMSRALSTLKDKVVMPLLNVLLILRGVL
jgi:RNA polymerase sigma factor (sigma-70 family)